MSDICQADGCDKAGSLQCPTCVKLKLPQARYCGEVCFKASWDAHKLVHKEAKLKMAEKLYMPPSFAYTSALRPHYVTPLRSVPDTIQKPEYWKTGEPLSEQEHKATNIIPIYTPEQIEGIRAACKLGMFCLIYDFVRVFEQ